jgi:dTMP kinase
MSLFITFEGGEGSGKSSQAKILFRSLYRLSLSVLLTHEPGGTPQGERISKILKSKENKELSPLTELLLFNASRTQLISEVIKPNLKHGTIIICDRFTDSTIAYQGFGRGLNLKLIETVNDIAAEGIKPDLTILLDVPAQEGLSRKSKQNLDRFHQEEISFHNRIRSGFLQLAGEEPDRWFVVNGLLSKKYISQTIWNRVTSLLLNNHFLKNVF